MPAFVCREDAFVSVANALEQPPALVLVEGEAGIGKTRLIQECLWSGGRPERTVLMVECQPVAESLPLGPVLDGLRRLRDEIGGVELSPLGGALRPLFPEWADDLPPLPEPLEDSGATRHRAYRALGELVDRLKVDLLVLEDAHWADSASLEWLLVAWEHWGDRRSVVVTYRPQSVPAASPQLRRLASWQPAGLDKVRIVLEPLDVAGIQQLTASMFRTDVSLEFAEFLHQRTGGLPLAVEECLKLLRDRGDIERRDGGWGRRKALTELRVPPNLRDSVLERVERLDPRTRRVLEAAAVLAEPADDRLLAAVAGLEERAASDAVAEGFRAGLLRGAGVGRVTFRHQLTAEAVDAEIATSERRRMHQRAGEALARAGEPSAARLAYHFQEAGDTEAWTRYAEETADLAQQSGDDHTVVTMLYDVLTKVSHPGDRRARLARQLGEAAASGAASLTDRAGPVMEALRQVLAHGDIQPGERGGIRLPLARLLRWHGQTEAADDEVELAILELDGRPVLACRAMLNLGVAFSRDWPVRQHIDWIEKATARFSEITSATERLQLEALRVSALLGLGQEEGWSAAAKLPRVGSNPTQQRMIMLSMADIGRLAIKWGRYAEARRLLTTAIELIQATGYQRALGVARTGRAYLDWYTGRWEGLGQTATELAEAEATEQPSVRVEARGIQALVELATGARTAAERHLAGRLDGLARHAPLGHQAATTVAALGRLRLAEGAVEQALQVTGPVVARIAAKGLWLWATDAIWVYVDALIRAGRLRQAEELAEQLAGWVAGRDAPAPAAASVLCQAIVTEARGELEPAAKLFAKAADAWAELPRPYDELLSLERQGRCLLTAEAIERGLAVLTNAQQRLQELGAVWDADRVARSLRKLGARIPRPWGSGPRGDGDQLSPRERDVLALVAKGMTNREVGRVLFLSPKTVGYYLGIAMRKLGVSTRTSAAMAATEAGLIPPDSEEPAGTSANGRD